MILKYMNKFEDIREKLTEKFEIEQPKSYRDILVKTMELIFKDDGNADRSKYEVMEGIEASNCKGTLLFVILVYCQGTIEYYYTKVENKKCNNTNDAYKTAMLEYKSNCKIAAYKMVLIALHMIERLKKNIKLYNNY